MELSIIIVSYNTREILRDCLKSVFEFSAGMKVEVIVVDNASSDGSVEMVVQDFPEVILLANKDNRGFAAANNQGFEIAQGEFWLLLNSDTLLRDNVLQASLCYMRQNADAGMLGCRVLNQDLSLQQTCFMWPSLFNLAIQATGLGRVFPESRFFRRERLQGWLRDSEREVDSITGCFLLVRASATRRIGLLDEDFFFYGEETDWCRRFKDGGYRVMFVPLGEIIHLGGASGDKTHYSRKLLLAQAQVRLQRKHHGLIAALIAWLLLWCESFNKSIGFGVVSLVKPRFRAAFMKHFGALIHFKRAWAGRGTKVRKKVLAVASSGGHWQQLLRLEELFDSYDCSFVSTRSDYRTTVLGSRFFTVADVNRWRKWRIPFACIQMFCIMLRVRPDVVISTGALPGLIAVILGRVFGARCIWLDSIANSEELSLSGRIAGKFAQLWLTQWEHLAGDGDDQRPEYAGRVL